MGMDPITLGLLGLAGAGAAAGGAAALGRDPLTGKKKERPAAFPVSLTEDGKTIDDGKAIIEERERLERRRRGRGGTILTSPAGALLGVPGTAPRLGGATILGG